MEHDLQTFFGGSSFLDMDFLLRVGLFVKVGHFKVEVMDTHDTSGRRWHVSTSTAHSVRVRVVQPADSFHKHIVWNVDNVELERVSREMTDRLWMNKIFLKEVASRLSSFHVDFDGVFFNSAYFIDEEGAIEHFNSHVR